MTDTPADVIVAVQAVTRVYRVGDVDVHALRGVDLTVQKGELLAIVGSSGSGKSTLMAILGCLDRPTGGRYLLDGTDVATLTEPQLAAIRSERLGFVFQSFNLLARTSALENVALPLFYSGAHPTTSERIERARDSLRLLGLSDRERNTPGQLSGGQQQRVAIARALINDPVLLLADEPTGNLDTQTSHDIMASLVALNREHGVTVIVVTHEADIAAYTDRVVTMRDGQIVADELRTSTVARVSDSKQAPLPTARLSTAVSNRSAQGAFALMVLAAAVQAIGRNKLRSGLTMLGVFIGVAALIAMVAVGQGANEAVRQQIQGLGTNMLVVLPGATTSGGARGGFGSASTLTVADAEAIRRDAGAVSGVGYLIRQSGQVQFGAKNWTTTIQGVSASYPDIANWHVGMGRGLTVEDNVDAALVMVIGQSVYHQLFADYENPVGATISAKGVPFRVVGLYAAKGQSASGQDQDDLIMIPFTTAERKVLGVAAPSQSLSGSSSIYVTPANPFGIQPKLTGYVNTIIVQAANSGLVTEALHDVTAILLRRHRAGSAETADFNVRNLSQIADAAQNSSRVMALLLATVASISLLVGGIGIMNILLVSVTERTREIGLRMAIGARRLQVLLQFLAEAVLLSVTGGVIGIVVGILASEIISAVADWPIVISTFALLGGFLFSIVVGVFFGYYPARRAAGLDPIEALRYE